MPRIFDNIDNQLLPTLKTTMCVSHRADFCVGYFNLRGWRQLDAHIEQWAGGDGECCRLLVGMQTLPQQELAEAYRIIKQDGDLDQQTAVRLKKSLAGHFRDQFTLGAPTEADEAGLRRLAAQIKAGRVVVKLHLRQALYACPDCVAALIAAGRYNLFINRITEAKQYFDQALSLNPRTNIQKELGWLCLEAANYSPGASRRCGAGRPTAKPR
jgi:hypothetical protein